MFSKILYILVISILSFNTISFSQKIAVNVKYDRKINHPGSDTIYYDMNQKLSWSDFRGPVPLHAKWGAMTSSGFSFNSEMEDDGEGHMSISVGVYCFFTKHNSWKKPEVQSAYHLEHEQHHFDITRIFAEKLVTKLRTAHFTRNNYRRLLRSVFNKVYAESVAYQQEYDAQTKNSMDTAMQEEWNRKISSEIAAIKSGK